MKSISNLIISLIEEMLQINGYDVKDIIDNMGHMKSIEDRKNGHVFSMSEHISGLVFSLLSSQKKWEDIERNEHNIVEIFKEFDKEYIVETDHEVFEEKLREIKCGNRAIKKQMQSLAYNIHIFEQIENDFGSLDTFIESSSTHNIAKELAEGEKYKLKQIGYPLAMEYLRNVGVDAAKPDTHIIRILSGERLGYHEDIPTPEEAIEIMEAISKETGLALSYLDALLWNFCSSGSGNICNSNPRCKRCKLDPYCNGVAEEMN
jgi:thermostable 8-oxoguanine DNA glycosylase